MSIFRSSHPDVFLRKGVLKICRKFTGEHPCRSAISIKLQSNLVEIVLRHGCFPVNLLHIFRTPFPKNTSGRLVLNFLSKVKDVIRTIATRGKLPPAQGWGFGQGQGQLQGWGPTRQLLRRKIVPLVWVRVWVRVSFRVGEQFSSGAIVLEPLKMKNYEC